MKKVFVIIFMLTSAVSFNQVAKAEDGSLKIDAETKKNNKTYDEIEIKENKIDVGLLNPPFKMAQDDIEEFDFIFSNLSAVKKNGKVILIRKSRKYGKNYSKIKKTA